jgi:hypothetical protein
MLVDDLGRRSRSTKKVDEEGRRGRSTKKVDEEGRQPQSTMTEVGGPLEASDPRIPVHEAGSTETP